MKRAVRHVVLRAARVNHVKPVRRVNNASRANHAVHLVRHPFQMIMAMNHKVLMPRYCRRQFRPLVSAIVMPMMLLL